MAAAQHVDRASPSSWSGMHERTSAPSWSPAREERQALGVVPVQVAEQQRAAERLARRAARPAAASPVPASSTRLGGLAVAGDSATHDVLPP